MTLPIIIIGSGHAAIQICSQLKLIGWNGKLMVISEEQDMPYQRPALSKGWLLQNPQLAAPNLKPAHFYQDAGIDLRLNTRVTGIDKETKQLVLGSGEVINYHKLILCTGATARTLPIVGAELNGVHYLRTAQQAFNLRLQLPHLKKVAVIGAGFIGLEVAATLRSLNIEVTVIEAGQRVLARAVCPAVSEALTEIHKQNGVQFIFGAGVERVLGRERVSAVQCSDGQLIEADLILVAIGASPSTELAEQAGIKVTDGILVDEYCQTSDQSILAAGDCTRYHHDLFQTFVRLESISNAMEQAKTIATVLVEKPKAFNRFVPRFWSDQYQFKLQIAGLHSGYDRVEIEAASDKEGVRTLYFKNQILIAAAALNNPAFINQTTKLIAERWVINESEIEQLMGRG